MMLSAAVVLRPTMQTCGETVFLTNALTVNSPIPDVAPTAKELANVNGKIQSGMKRRHGKVGGAEDRLEEGMLQNSATEERREQD